MKPESVKVQDLVECLFPVTEPQLALLSGLPHKPPTQADQPRQGARLRNRLLPTHAIEATASIGALFVIKMHCLKPKELPAQVHDGKVHRRDDPEDMNDGKHCCQNFSTHC